MYFDYSDFVYFIGLLYLLVLMFSVLGLVGVFWIFSFAFSVIFNYLFFGVQFFYCIGGTYKYLIVIFVFLKALKYTVVICCTSGSLFIHISLMCPCLLPGVYLPSFSPHFRCSLRL